MRGQNRRVLKLAHWTLRRWVFAKYHRKFADEHSDSLIKSKFGNGRKSVEGVANAAGSYEERGAAEKVAKRSQGRVAEGPTSSRTNAIQSPRRGTVGVREHDA